MADTLPPMTQVGLGRVGRLSARCTTPRRHASRLSTPPWQVDIPADQDELVCSTLVRREVGLRHNNSQPSPTSRPPVVENR